MWVVYLIALHSRRGNSIGMVLLPFINMSQCSEKNDLELKSSLALTLTSLTLFLTFSIHDFLRISSTFFDHVAESETNSRAARETEPVPPEEPWEKKHIFIWLDSVSISVLLPQELKTQVLCKVCFVGLRQVSRNHWCFLPLSPAMSSLPLYF